MVVSRLDIGIWSCARLKSERCPGKMTRPLGDTTLTDIILRKFSQLEHDTFFGGYEQILKDKCTKHGIDFVQRTKKSSDAEVAVDIYDFVLSQPNEYLLQVNACIPFL